MDGDYDDLHDVELMELDEAAEENFGINFGQIVSQSSGGVATARSDFTDLYHRFGAKKALAPYITQPLFLRQFFEDCGDVLERLEQTKLLAPFHEVPHPADDGEAAAAWSAEREKQSQQEKQLKSQNRKIIIDPGAEKAEQQRRQVALTMLDLRNRVKQSGISLTQSPLSMDQCISHAPKLITLRYRKADHAVANHSQSGAVQFTRSQYSAPYVQDLYQRVGKGPGLATIPKELRITVRIYRGRLPIKQSEHKNLSLLLVLYCLGSSTLKDLIARIPCSVDSDGVIGASTAQDEFVYIEKTFYTEDIETEESKAKYYRGWMSHTLSIDTGLVPLDSRTLLDVELALGAPYLYKHGAIGCEHFIVFSDVRFLHQDDELDLSLYPRIVYQAPQKYPICTICGDKSKWQVNYSKRFPRRLNYVCDLCNGVFNFCDGVQVEPGVVLVPLTASEETGSERGASQEPPPEEA